MALDNDVIRARLKETFGAEQQEVTAGRLNVVQGTISKVLSGNQTLTLEMAYHIAQEYQVSVDWLLGLSEEKKNIKIAETSYASATRVLADLKNCGAISSPPNTDNFFFKIDDPILLYLYSKGRKLLEADREFYKDWITNKLNAFADKEVLYSMAWKDENVMFLTGEASKDEHWLEVYRQAKASYDDYVDAMGDDPGPFGE